MPDSPPHDHAEAPTLAPPPNAAAFEGDATLPPAAGVAPAESLLRPGTPVLPMVLGRYRLERQLGQGGMGAVYLAEDLQLGRRVALKIPFLRGPADEAIRARFLREARSAALLAHPNICPVHDLGEIDGVPYLTMAFVEGCPLSRQCGAGRPMEPGRAVALVRQVASALDEAHRHGIIHRDLKPANVMIDGRVEPIVMDFGLARRADDILGLTQEGEMMGTPACMPPEQFTGSVREMGPACDIYSLGVMLYELLAGRPPFVGDLMSLAAQVACDAPAPPSHHRPGLDPRLDAACLVALAKRPSDRYASMRAFADALAALGPAPAVMADGLSLRLVGTPVSYRPPPGRAGVSLGRQKRRPGEPPEAGNDRNLGPLPPGAAGVGGRSLRGRGPPPEICRGAIRPGPSPRGGRRGAHPAFARPLGVTQLMGFVPYSLVAS